MKKIYYILTSLLLTATVLLTQQATAQAPQKMSYQSVIRNSSNVLLANTAVGIRISVLQGSVSGPAVYVETQTATTNGNGLVSIQIGSASFASINWAAGPYFIKTETDPAGGSNYSITGTQEILSVPYAMYATKSGDSTRMGAIGGSSNVNGATINSGVLRLTPADATNGGVVTTGAQTFSGAKTFTDDLKASQNIISGTPSWATDGKIQSWNTNYNGRVLSVIGNNANYTGAAATFWNQGSGPSVAFDYGGSGQKIISFQNQGNEIASVKTNGAINANSFVKTGGTSSQYLMADGSTSIGATGPAGSNSFVTTAGDATAIHNTNTGNVGIGTDSPDGKLDVNGNVFVRNNLYVLGIGSFTDVSFLQVNRSMAVSENITIVGNSDVFGTTTANSFVKAGGTSSQILMADGSTTQTIRGRVNANGTIAAGSAFTVALTSTGIYTINFVNSFQSIPIVVATGASLSGIVTCTISSVSLTSAVVVVTGSTGPINSPFNFIIMAP